MDCEWDPAKPRANFLKHGVHFADAVTALEDEMALTIPDPYSEEEERWITLGNDALGRLLVVIYTWRRAKQVRGRGNNMSKTLKREYDFSRAKRGRVLRVSKGKTRITIRLDHDVLDWFRKQVDEAGGGNYQTLINEALRRHISQIQEPLEATLRRVIREELTEAGTG